jgi:hypothetical protein
MQSCGAPHRRGTRAHSASKTRVNALMAHPTGLFDIVKKECGLAHASAGTIRRVSMRALGDVLLASRSA